MVESVDNQWVSVSKHDGKLWRMFIKQTEEVVIVYKLDTALHIARCITHCKMIDEAIKSTNFAFDGKKE